MQAVPPATAPHHKRVVEFSFMARESRKKVDSAEKVVKLMAAYGKRCTQPVRFPRQKLSSPSYGTLAG